MRRVKVKRPSWEDYFIGITDKVRERSTCSRLAVGSIIVKDNKILSTGYNGSPQGEEHCNEVGCYISNGSCIRTIHAEMNAIMNSLEQGVNIEGASIYVTHYPCYNCAKHIVQVGIKEVIYKEDYRNNVEVEKLFSRRGVGVRKL